jgi:hypothetical protein
MGNYTIVHNNKVPLIANDKSRIATYFEPDFFWAKTLGRYIYSYTSTGQTWATSSIVGMTNSSTNGIAYSPQGQLLVNISDGTYSYVQTSNDNGNSWSSLTATQSLGEFIWSKTFNKFVGGKRNAPPGSNPSLVLSTYSIIEVAEWGAIFSLTIEYAPSAAYRGYKSTDGGVTWTTVNAYGTSMAFNGTTLVVTGLNFTFTSTDGTNFTSTTDFLSPSKIHWDGIRGCFWGIVTGDTVLKRSTNGTTWTTFATGFNYLVDVKSNAGKIILAGIDGSKTIYYESFDGATWSTAYTIVNVASGASGFLLDTIYIF